MILGALLVLSLVLGKGAGGRSGAPAVVHPNRAPGVVAAAAIVARRRTATSVLGVRIGMSETQAHRRLGALGLKRRLDNEEAENEGSRAGRG